MEIFVQIIHYVICVFLILIILLQAGRGAEIGASFGGSAQTLFGPRGAATFLNKLTTIVALGFIVTSVVLAEFAQHRTSKSALDVVAPSAVTLPATPAPEGGTLTEPAGPPAPAETTSPSPD